MYSFEQLKIFVAVCDSGSFSAAARKLGRVQSGVSQAIANLELAINQELFTREKNILQLTPAGQALLPIAKSILHQQHFFDQKVVALEQSVEHSLTIAIDDCLLNDELLSILAELSHEFPITNIDVVSGSTFDIEEWVRTNQAHIGLIFADGELREDMDFFTLGQMRFLNVVAPSHELASLSLVRDVDLKRHRQIIHRSGSKKELWFSYGISGNYWHANTHGLLLDIACKGIGWAVVPEAMAKPYIDQSKLVALPVAHELNGWLTTTGCLVSRTQSSGPVLQRLIERLQNL